MTVTARSAGDLLTAAIFNTKLEAPINTAELADLLITTAKLANGAVNAPKIGTLPKVRAYNSVAISIPTASETIVPFDSERYDSDAIHDTAVSTGRLTCKTAGLYRITGRLRFAANTTGIRYAYLRLNGATIIDFDARVPLSGLQTYLLVSTEYQLAVNDYVELIAYQNSGAALNLEAAPNHSPEFMMSFISA